MSYIDSTSASPLAAASDLEDDGPAMAKIPGLDDEPDDDEEEPQERAEREGTLVEQLQRWAEDINVAREIDEQTLNTIGAEVMREYQLDENSRAEWLADSQKAMRFALQEAEPKTTPWQGASNIIFPLISQAAIQFGTRTYPALIQGKKVVKGVVWGGDRGTPATADGKPDGQPQMGPPGPNGEPAQPVWLVAPGEKRSRADRIGEHMSWQLLSEMREWEPQTDQLLHQIPIMGGAVRKTFRDIAENKNCSLVVGLQNLVWDYNAASFEDAPRHSELLSIYPDEIWVNEHTDADEHESGEGMFLHLDYGPGGGGETDQERADGEQVHHDASDSSAPHTFIEQHRRYDLDGDGYAEPWVITVHARSQKVVRIVARYEKEDIKASKDGETIIKVKPTEIYTLIPFLPNIKGGSYPMGFGHLLEHLSEGINTTLNQMFDAGTLQNSGGGFIGDQLGMPSGQVNFQVGKYVRVTTKGQSIRDSVFPLPFQGPSPVLFQLLGVLMGAGKDFVGLQDVLSGDAAIANAPPTTILALIEQGLQLYTAIHKRIYRAFKSEFDKLYRLNRKYIDDAERYQIGDEWREIHPDDYRLGGGVEPVADPTMITDMQKLARAQILMGFKGDPDINQGEIKRRLFEAANIDRIDDLFVPPNPMAQVQMQMQMAKDQAEIGRIRAAEQKDATQAFLNLALAKSKATAQEEGFINAQLTFLRLHIEALNTQVKAAQVDHRFHDTGMRQTIEHARLAASTAADGPVQPTPDPTGAFPVPPDTPAPGGPAPAAAAPAEPDPMAAIAGPEGAQ